MKTIDNANRESEVINNKFFPADFHLTKKYIPNKYKRTIHSSLSITTEKYTIEGKIAIISGANLALFSPPDKN